MDVRFKYGNLADYNALQVKDTDTLYFIIDKHLIYKGDVLVTGKYDISITNGSGTNGTTLVLSILDNTTGQTMTLTTYSTVAIDAIVTTVTNLSTTVGQIQNTIISIQGDITTIQGNITTIEGNITTIQGNITTIETNFNAHVNLNASDTVKGHTYLQDHFLPQAEDPTSPYATVQSIAKALDGITSATPKAVYDALQMAKAYAESLISGSIDAMLFKGTLGTAGTVQSLPNVYNTGWVYIVATAGTYVGKECAVGDMIVSIVTRETAGTGTNDDWAVIERNLINPVQYETQLAPNQLVLGGTNTDQVKPLPAGTNGQLLTMVNGQPTWSDAPEQQQVDCAGWSSLGPFWESLDVYYTLVALEPGSFVSIERVGSSSSLQSIVLQYSLNGGTWSSYVLGTKIFLDQVGSYIKFRGTNSNLYYNATNYHKVVAGGAIKQVNWCGSLLDNVGSVFNKTINSLYLDCFALKQIPEINIFAVNSQYESAFKNTGLQSVVVGTGGASYSNLLKSAFSGCTLLSSAVLSETASSGRYYSAFENTHLTRVKCGFKTISSDMLSSWLPNTNGVCYYPSDAQYQVSALNLPSGWSSVVY